MNKILKKSLLPSVLGAIGGFFICPVSAHVYPDRPTTCYQFANNKLIKQQKCVVEAGGGAGGETEQFKLGGKEYAFTTSEDYDDKSQTSITRLTFTTGRGKTWHQSPTKSYSRQEKSFLKLKNNASIPPEKTLTCYLVPSEKLDVCYAN